MNACPNRTSFWIILPGLLLSLACPVQAADEKYDATITFCSGLKSMVKDFRVVYAWREMPANSEGLTPYKLRSLGEQGLWVSNRDKGSPAFKLIPFSEIDSIEVDSSVQQLGVSQIYEFRIEGVRVQRQDGKRMALSDSVLSENMPVLWPHHARLTFPEGLGDKRIDRVTVTLQGKTKIDGVDSEFLFVLPNSLTEANQSLLKKTRDAFPQKIQINRGGEVRTAQTAR